MEPLPAGIPPSRRTSPPRPLERRLYRGSLRRHPLFPPVSFPALFQPSVAATQGFAIPADLKSVLPLLLVRAFRQIAVFSGQGRNALDVNGEQKETTPAVLSGKWRETDDAFWRECEA